MEAYSQVSMAKGKEKHSPKQVRTISISGITSPELFKYIMIEVILNSFPKDHNRYFNASPPDAQ